MLACRICNSTDSEKFKVREMLHGFRDEFDYFKCKNCGCLQIENFPENISKYYPQNYFSFDSPKEENPLKEILNSQRDKFELGKNNFLGKILHKKFETPTYIKRFQKLKINFDDKILDVGCGSGKLLYRMANAGFKNAIGIDPFINQNLEYENGLKIFKKDLFKVDEKFDLIMLHHSLEHMENQHKVFEKLNSILFPDKFLMIRIPVVDSKAWEIYKENWAHLDAPRHFYLHTKKSIQIMADKYGFEILDLEFDSNGSQYWASIQYQKNISYYEEKSYGVNPQNSIFTQKEIDDFENEAINLNEMKFGDQACFYLRKM